MAPNHKSSAELGEQLHRLRDERNRVGIEFLMVDLDLSLTFADAALDDNHDEEKRERNRVSARKGYDSVVHLMNQIEIPAPQQHELEQKLRKLKSALEQVGERFEG